jgi:hypothetical protein
MNTLKRKYIIKDIALGNEGIYFKLFPNKIVTVPYDYTEKLKNAKKEDLKEYRLIGGGIGVHFEKIDEDISVDGLVKDFIEKYQKITVTLPHELVNKLDEMAVSLNKNRSKIIQEALKRI